MMRQRVLPRDSAAEGVRIRVVACRKRLRILRAIHKAQIHFPIGGEGEFETLPGRAPTETEAVLVEESALILPFLEGQDAQLT